jgi:hypothetical protein
VAARFHLGRNRTGCAKRMLDDEMRPGQRGLDYRGIAELILNRNIARRSIEELRCTRLHGIDSVDDRRQYIVRHFYRFRRGARLQYTAGDDHRDWFAYVSHLVLGKRQVRQLQRRSLLAERLDLVVDRIRRISAMLDAACAGGDEVIGRQHSNHAEQSARGRPIDTRHAGMRVGGSHENRMGLSGIRYVVGVVPLPGYQPRILKPRHPAADIRLSAFQFRSRHPS